MSTNLTLESTTLSRDADGSPRLRESVNVISFFKTGALPIPIKEDTVCVTPIQGMGSKEIGNYCGMVFYHLIDINDSMTSRTFLHSHLNCVWQVIGMSMQVMGKYEEYICIIR